MTERYNGWTNYETWRVNLELFDSMEFDEKVDGDYIEELAHEIVIGETTEAKRLMADYASAFLARVDWHEIAHNVNDYNGHGDPVLIAK